MMWASFDNNGQPFPSFVPYNWFSTCIAISFEIGLQAAPKNALKRCIFRLASAHFKSKRLYDYAAPSAAGKR